MAWEATAERFCTGCRRWVPALDIKRGSRCAECVRKSRRASDKLRGVPGCDPARVSNRQLEVLRARFRYGSRKDAAVALGISEHTVRSHMERMCQRLGVNNAMDAVYVLWLRDLWGEG